MAKQSKGARAFNRWRKAEGRDLSVAAVSEQIGDPGGQLAKWASGSRAKLPIQLLVALARHTGLPLEVLASRDQVRMVRELVALTGEDDPPANPPDSRGGSEDARHDEAEAVA